MTVVAFSGETVLGEALYCSNVISLGKLEAMFHFFHVSIGTCMLLSPEICENGKARHV
jgi:hypothetical protein